MSTKPIPRLSGLAVVTGASSGIGLELARCAAADGCDLLLVADRDLSQGADAARAAGAASVETLNADLSTIEGIMAVMAAIGERPVAALFANAGAGEGGAFLDEAWEDIERTIETNVTGTTALVHAVGQRMRERNAGRILITGSIVGGMPGAFMLTYSSSKSFLNDFTVGLAEELRDSDVTVTCLMPGGTDTEFFHYADMEDTLVGRIPKADPARVAADGYRALLNGKTMAVSGLMNKVLNLFGDILPGELVAEMHRQMSMPDRYRKGAHPA